MHDKGDIPGRYNPVRQATSPARLSSANAQYPHTQGIVDRIQRVVESGRLNTVLAGRVNWN